MFSGMGPARSCLMISRLWNQIKDGGSSGWCRRYSGLSLGSETWDILHGITCLILCYLGREAEVYWSSSDWQICWGRGRSKRITTCCLLLMPKPALDCFSGNLAEEMSITRIPPGKLCHSLIQWKNVTSCWISGFSWTLTKGQEMESLLCVVCLHFHFISWSVCT